MAVEQTGQPHRRFEKKNGKKGISYCPIHRTDAHDLIECKVMLGIINKELGERKLMRDNDSKDEGAPDQSALGFH